AGADWTPEVVRRSPVVPALAPPTAAIPPRVRPRSVISPAVVHPAKTVPGALRSAAASAVHRSCRGATKRKPNVGGAPASARTAAPTASSAAFRVSLSVERPLPATVERSERVCVAMREPPPEEDHGLYKKQRAGPGAG